MSPFESGGKKFKLQRKWVSMSIIDFKAGYFNWSAQIRHLCMEITIHRCVIVWSVDKMNKVTVIFTFTPFGFAFVLQFWNT